MLHSISTHNKWFLFFRVFSLDYFCFPQLNKKLHYHVVKLVRSVFLCSFGPRFPAMSDAYDAELIQLAKKVGHELGLDSILRQGVYSFLVGPSFETIAECRLLKTLGVDATGNAILLPYQFSLGV